MGLVAARPRRSSRGRPWTAASPSTSSPSMIILGFGIGMAMNPLLLAAMSDVEPEESGLASGVVNTSFMMGGALGLAVLASVAAARTGDGTSLAALTDGYHAAFLVGTLFAVAAGAVAAVFMRDAQPRRRTHARKRSEASTRRKELRCSRTTRTFSSFSANDIAAAKAVLRGDARARRRARRWAGSRSHLARRRRGVRLPEGRPRAGDVHGPQLPRRRRRGCTVDRLTAAGVGFEQYDGELQHGREGDRPRRARARRSRGSRIRPGTSSRCIEE